MWDQEDSGPRPRLVRPPFQGSPKRGLRFQWVLIVVAATAVLCALFVPTRPAAADESTNDNSTITTVLQPGWNMVAWLGPEVSARELLAAIPRLQHVAVWDGARQRYRSYSREGAEEDGLFRIPRGAGVWLEVGGDEPFQWVRVAASESVLLELQAGDNLVGWSGRDGVDLSDALSRLKPVLIKAIRWNAEAGSYEFYSPLVPDSLNTSWALNHGDALLLELTESVRWWQSRRQPTPSCVPRRIHAGQAGRDPRMG